MAYKIKRIIYVSFMFIMKLLWLLKGKRSIKAFAQQYYVTHDTIFPTYRKFRLPKGDCFSEIVRFTDFVQLHALCNLLSKLSNPMIIEVGAHHGSYAVILGKFAEKTAGRVIAIEPDPMSFKKLCKNILLNKLDDFVVVENIAISDTCGIQKFILDGSQGHLCFGENKTVHSTRDVTVLTLDTLLQKHNIRKVDLLIIDVEGAELLVLKSISWESCQIDNIYCELHPYAWQNFGYSSYDFVEFINKHKFRIFDMYSYEHSTFDESAYIGPTIFVRQRE